MLNDFFQAVSLIYLLQDQMNFLSLKITPKQSKRSNSASSPLVECCYLLIYRIGNFFIGFPVYPPLSEQAIDPSNPMKSTHWVLNSPLSLHSECWRTFVHDPAVKALVDWCNFLWENEQLEKRREEKRQKKKETS